MKLGIEKTAFNPLDALLAFGKACGLPIDPQVITLTEVRGFLLAAVARSFGLNVLQEIENGIVVGLTGRYKGRLIHTVLRFNVGLSTWGWTMQVIDPDFAPILSLSMKGSGRLNWDAEPSAPHNVFTRAVADDLLDLFNIIAPAAKIESEEFQAWLECHGIKRVFNYEWEIPCTALAANWCAADMIANTEYLGNANTFAEAWDYFNERLGKFQDDSAYTAMFEQSRQHYLRAIANELLNAYGLVTSQRDKGLVGLRAFISTKCYDAMKATMKAGEALPSGSRLVATSLYKIASLHADFQANG